MRSHSTLPRARGRRRRAGGDEGVSLIETIVALAIAGAVLASMSIALLQTAKASVTARQNQQAADVMNEQLEYVRSLDYAKATHLTSDLAGDSLLTYNSGTQKYTFATSAGNETVVSANVGLLTQHIQTVTRQNTPYTVRTYITQVADAVNTASDYRRVTVLLEWTLNGVTHSRRSSTFITDTRRGLPLPRFTMGTSGTFKTNVGAVLSLPVKITNVGAPDSFNLTATTPPSGSWSWYADTNGDGVYTSGTDQALGDSDTNGASDTGIMQVSQSVTVFAVRTISVGEPSTQTITITGTSAAQPTAATATNGFSDTILVNPATCTGCTLTTFYLHNSSTYADTVYQSTTGSNTPMYMDKNAPASSRTILYNYSLDCLTLTASTDCASVPYGRHVLKGGTSTESNKTKVAAWYYSVPNPTVLKGTASITIWVQQASGSGPATQITAYVGADNNNNISGTFVPSGSGTASVPASTSSGWTAVTIGVPLTTNLDSSGSLSINQNKYLAVRVTASGDTNIRLAYDTQTYNAQAVLPVVSG